MDCNKYVIPEDPKRPTKPSKPYLKGSSPSLAEVKEYSAKLEAYEKDFAVFKDYMRDLRAKEQEARCRYMVDLQTELGIKADEQFRLLYNLITSGDYSYNCGRGSAGWYVEIYEKMDEMWSFYNQLKNAEKT